LVELLARLPHSRPSFPPRPTFVVGAIKLILHGVRFRSRTVAISASVSCASNKALKPHGGFSSSWARRRFTVSAGRRYFPARVLHRRWEVHRSHKLRLRTAFPVMVVALVDADGSIHVRNLPAGRRREAPARQLARPLARRRRNGFGPTFRLTNLRSSGSMAATC